MFGKLVNKNRKMKEMFLTKANLYEYEKANLDKEGFRFIEKGVLLVKDVSIFDKNRTEPLPEGPLKNMAYGVIVSDENLLGEKLLLESLLSIKYVVVKRSNINMDQQYKIIQQARSGDKMAEPIANDGVIKIDELIKRYATINEKAYQRAKAVYLAEKTQNDAIIVAKENMDELFG